MNQWAKVILFSVSVSNVLKKENMIYLKKENMILYT